MKNKHTKALILILTVGFIIYDMISKSTSYIEMLRFLLYGVAINIISDYITATRKNGKKK